MKDIVFLNDDPESIGIISEYLRTCADVEYVRCTDDINPDTKPGMIIIDRSDRFFPENEKPDTGISGSLLFYGVPANLKGFAYLREAALLACGDMRILDDMTGRLYTGVASIFGVRPGSVERAMRYAVRRTWDEVPDGIDGRLIRAKFRRSRKNPSNSLFIRMICEETQLR